MREGARERVEPGLRRGVDGVTRDPARARNGTHQDDAAEARFHHRRHDGANERDIGGQIRREDVQPFGLGEAKERSLLGDSRRGDEVADRPDFLFDLLDETNRLFGGRGRPRECSDPLHRGVTVAVVGQRDGDAVFGEKLHDRRSDPSRTSGDQGRALCVSQLHGALTPNASSAAAIFLAPTRATPANTPLRLVILIAVTVYKRVSPGRAPDRNFAWR